MNWESPMKAARTSSFQRTHLFQTLRSPRQASAFSLTEVVLAMGVAAIAFTSILGLFPLGLSISKESYEETQAALLAQTIMCDLRDQLTGTSIVNGRLLQVGELNSPVAWNIQGNYVNIDTSETRDNPITCYVAYNMKSRPDKTFQETALRPFTNVIATNEPDWYITGITNGTAFALAKIAVRATFRLDTDTGNPQRVDIAVEPPANLPVAKRKQFLFTGGVAP